MEVMARRKAVKTPLIRLWLFQVIWLLTDYYFMKEICFRKGTGMEHSLHSMVHGTALQSRRRDILWYLFLLRTASPAVIGKYLQMILPEAQNSCRQMLQSTGHAVWHRAL